ncbi:MAG: hypothetical protein PHY93_02410 [Bacteriovorax sp.]|nr:hypothetical protein [Bacteriovorax sp.]
MLKKNIFSLIVFAIIYSTLNTSFAAGEAAAVLTGQGTSAVTGAATNAASKAAINNAAPGLTDKIGEFFDTPVGILLVSGIGTVYSGILYNAASEQEKESKANIEKIDKLIATYKDSWISYCPNGRESLNEPNCYCYTDAGKQNPDRTKSQTCIDLWAKNSYLLSATKGDYSGVPQFVDPSGCLTISGQFDESCKCKKFVDAKGNNACAKGTSVSIPTGAFGSSFIKDTGIKDVLKYSANTNNGNPRFDLLSAGQLGLKAIATNRMLDSMIAQFPSSSKGGAKATYANDKNIAQLSKAVFGERAIAAAVANSKSAMDVSSSGPSNPTASALLKTAAARAGIDLTGGHGLQNKKANPKEAMNFNFAGDNANGASQTQNFPEKNYNYKNSDISNKSDVSIFDIISNRYIQSGLKRLFEN